VIIFTIPKLLHALGLHQGFAEGARWNYEVRCRFCGKLICYTTMSDGAEIAAARREAERRLADEHYSS